jgi:hypothetical protein
MTAGFQSYKKAHNRAKRQNRQNRRIENKARVRNLLNGKEDFSGSKNKNGGARQDWGYAGLSFGNSYASHRKRTTRQKCKLDILEHHNFLP